MSIKIVWEKVTLFHQLSYEGQIKWSRIKGVTSCWYTADDFFYEINLLIPFFTYRFHTANLFFI